MSLDPKVLFIGEAMLELVQKPDNLLAKSFAGDVYNTSVYLKRAYNDLQISFLTGLGHDSLSSELISRMTDEGISTDFIALSDDKHIGTYMVVTDETGQRSFTYWRNDSAAKSVFSLLSQTQQDALINDTNPGDMVFFSGISLAILHEQDRDKLFSYLSVLKNKGARIVFDPNYRPALWESENVAKEVIEKAFSQSDFLMPGLDDFTSLYGFTTVDQCISFCEQFEFTELVLKQGANSVHVVNQDGHQEIDIVKSDNVVDTTSAGDAFNGIYLGARLDEKTPADATKLANYAASKVIETPGAIMPAELFEKAWGLRPA